MKKRLYISVFNPDAATDPQRGQFTRLDHPIDGANRDLKPIRDIVTGQQRSASAAKGFGCDQDQTDHNNRYGSEADVRPD